MGINFDDLRPRQDRDSMWRDSSISSRFPAPPFVGAGLRNLGNTCFLNSVLQCMTHMVPLLEKLIESQHPSPCSVVEEGEEFCTMCALRGHIYQSVRNAGGFFSPYKFANNLSKISSTFKLGQQEDAHEFLCCLLDKLNTSCIAPGSKDQASSLEKDGLVENVFGGRLRNQLRCYDCGLCSDSFEDLLDICMEIRDVETLTDALASFTKVEKVEANCEGCKAQVKEKQVKLDQAPAVIALQLKRFENNFEKIDKFIKYPLELDLKPYLSNADAAIQSNYDLYAVVVHTGSAFFGHYYSIVRSSQMSWHLMEDSQVTRVYEHYVLDQNAYVLFYVKRGLSPWFSSFIRSKEMPNYMDLYRDESPISVLDHKYKSLVPYSGGSSSSSSETTEKEPLTCEIASSESREAEAHKDHGTSPLKNNPFACGIASSKSREAESHKDHGTSPFKADVAAEKTTQLRTPDKSIGMFQEEGASPRQSDNWAERTIQRHTPKKIIDKASSHKPNVVAAKTSVRHTAHGVLDMFEDEILEDDDDDVLVPQVIVGQKRSREPEKAAIKNTPVKTKSDNKKMDDVDDPRLSQLGRIMSSMPGSRRAGLLSCIPQKSSPRSESRINKKRSRLF